MPFANLPQRQVILLGGIIVPVPSAAIAVGGLIITTSAPTSITRLSVAPLIKRPGNLSNPVTILQSLLSFRVEILTPEKYTRREPFATNEVFFHVLSHWSHRTNRTPHRAPLAGARVTSTSFCPPNLSLRRDRKPGC